MLEAGLRAYHKNSSERRSHRWACIRLQGASMQNYGRLTFVISVKLTWDALLLSSGTINMQFSSASALGRTRYERGRTPEEGAGAEAARSRVSGHRHGRRERALMGTFGAVTVCVPRARLATPEGGTQEWRNTTIPAYQRLTRRAEALIAGAY